jgi:hypothetical protein
LYLPTLSNPSYVIAIIFDWGFNYGRTQDFSEMFIFKFLLEKISTLLHELEEDSIGG